MQFVYIFAEYKTGTNRVQNGYKVSTNIAKN